MFRNSTRTLMAKAFVVVLVSAGAFDAQASLVRFEFSGQLRDFIPINGDLQSTLGTLAKSDVVLDASFSGYYILDTSLPPTSVGETGATYAASVVDFGLQVGALSGDTASGDAGSATFGIQNNSSSGDIWNIPLGEIDFGAPQIDLLAFAVTLRDAEGEALDSLDIAQAPPVLEDFDGFIGGTRIYTSLNLFFQVNGFATISVNGEILSHEAVPIPLPPAIALLATGLVAIGRLMPRRHT